jgi:uncharacterized protein YkwD
MKKRYFSFIALALLLLLTACTGLPTITINLPTPGVTNPGSQTQGTSEEQQLTQQLFKQINQDRAANNLPPLAWEPRLEKSAHQHDLVMSKGCGMQHQCPNEPDLGTRITQQGVQWQAVGENIGEGNPVFSNANASNMVTAIHNGMMGEKPPDDGHRRNLLSKDFHRIGISIYIDNSNTLWLTEDFAN